MIIRKKWHDFVKLLNIFKQNKRDLEYSLSSIVSFVKICCIFCINGDSTEFHGELLVDATDLSRSETDNHFWNIPEGDEGRHRRIIVVVGSTLAVWCRYLDVDV